MRNECIRWFSRTLVHNRRRLLVLTCTRRVDKSRMRKPTLCRLCLASSRVPYLFNVVLKMLKLLKLHFKNINTDSMAELSSGKIT